VKFLLFCSLAYKDNAVISKLTVKNFQRYDAGRYQCKAVNDAGTQQQDFVIRGKN